MTAAPPRKEEEEEANNDDNHPVQQYTVPAHISGSTFSVSFIRPKIIIFSICKLFQGNKKLKFYLLNTQQTQKAMQCNAMYRLWAKIMLNQQSIIQNF
jgi:hypothetical protein